jgi:hypothetical protein
MLSLISCSSKNPQTGSESSSIGPVPNSSSYTSRVGIAVRTGGRTCIAIRNASLSPGSPVTLVVPSLPQTFTQAELAGGSSNPCPITKDVDPSVTSYELHVTQDSIPKLTPLIAVVGTAAPFSIVENNVRADLDQNGKAETFRACSSDNGIHLTVWFGKPVDAAVLWHGYYYEPNNPGVGPACTVPKETAPTP